MRIVITGPKASGKSSIGKLVADGLGIAFIETDRVLEEFYERRHGEALTCRQIYNSAGEQAFRELEKDAVEQAAQEDWCVIATGGSTLLDPDSRRLLRRDSIMVLITAPTDVLWKRMERIGLPKFYSGENGRQAFEDRLQTIIDVLTPYADIFVDTDELDAPQTAQRVLELLGDEIAVRSTSANTFGRTVRLTTFGESHGPAIGAILDGVPPGLELDESDIQKELDRRRPGQSGITTPRREPDKVRILSGVFEGKTTGAPIGLIIENTNQIPSHYDNIRDVFRPGHADFTFWSKYGHRDHRGGGRSSGRETSARVAGGAVARKVLAQRGVKIIAYALEVAGIRAQVVDYDQIERNPARCPDPEAAEKIVKAIQEARERGDSVGGIVQIEITGIPAGLGDPVFGKLDARLGGALLSLGAVKGVEFGMGFAAARMSGSQHNDQMADGTFLSNNAGGVLGGISTGQPVIARVVIKPTASVSVPQKTIDLSGENRIIRVEGRHDPCIVPRVIPVIENMAALVILDLWETQERIRGPLAESGQ